MFFGTLVSISIPIATGSVEGKWTKEFLSEKPFGNGGPTKSLFARVLVSTSLYFFSNSLDMFVHPQKWTWWRLLVKKLSCAPASNGSSESSLLAFFFPARWLSNSTGLHKTLVMCNHGHVTDNDADSPRGAAASWGSHRQWEMELGSESRCKCSLNNTPNSEDSRVLAWEVLAIQTWRLALGIPESIQY